MFTCQIRYLDCNGIYLRGIQAALDTVAGHHPGWQYDLQAASSGERGDEHLLIVDMSTCDCIHDAPSAYPGIFSRQSTLVLVKATQKGLIQALVNNHGCSLLCIAEHHFRMRAIVQAVLRHTRYLSPLIVRLSEAEGQASQIPLTPAECTVLNYLRKGWSGAEISRILFRSEKTISSHKRTIMGKMGVKDDLALRRKLASTVLDR
ncbi:response regulator transcription factor [Huaxiibacter chinensis]|uniref:response regulator transcription factor n=1 Tax=Huaxiibacter chinensis TaxID=2899785 RepID=UPI003D310EBE